MWIVVFSGPGPWVGAPRWMLGLLDLHVICMMAWDNCLPPLYYFLEVSLLILILGVSC